MGAFSGDFITNKFSEEIYRNIKDLPIIDYHCHLSPKEIYLDKPFDDIAELWLSGDHYKWRLMRSAGIDESFITGNAPTKEKFFKFMEAVGTAINNPVAVWVKLELATYFGITQKACAENAESIYEKCNKVIKDKKLSPKKLIEQSNVEYVATTDDPLDTLEFHKKLKQSFKVKVMPSFRTDKLFSVTDISQYRAYLDKLEKATSVQISSLNDLKTAVKVRLRFFIENGCKFSDIGIEGFPSKVDSDEKASKSFLKLLSNEPLSALEVDGFKGNLYAFLGRLYKENNIVQQWHLGAMRNANSKEFFAIGADSGFDCIDDAVSIKSVANMLDTLAKADSLPETIIYTLNPSVNYALAALTNSFRGVHLGISWWFNDNVRGMKDTFSTVSELCHISSLVGMLTDSRSFLSYVRHDLYRQVLAEFLSEVATEGDKAQALSVAKQLCYDNAKNLIEAK